MRSNVVKKIIRPQCGGRSGGRQPSDARMRPHSVVVTSPFFQRQTRLHQRDEQGLVQKLVAQPAIEALDKELRFERLKPSRRLFVFEHNPYNPLTCRLVSRCPVDRDAILLKPRETIARFERSGFSAVVANYCLFFPKYWPSCGRSRLRSAGCRWADHITFGVFDRKRERGDYLESSCYRRCRLYRQPRLQSAGGPRDGAGRL